MRIISRALAAALAVAALNFGAAAQAQSDYSVPRIIDIMRGTSDAANAPTLICAHRGYWRDVPENTLEAVSAALEMNIETVELDVRLAGDRVPVLMHDWALDRTTTGSGFVADRSSAEIRNMFRRDGSGHPSTIPVPTLEQALWQLYDHNSARTASPSNTSKKQRGYVLVLDVKDKHDARAVNSYEAAKETWAVIRRVQAEIDQKGPGEIQIAEAIVIKVLARELPPLQATYQEELGSINGVGAMLFPILYLQDLGDPVRLERWNSYLAARGEHDATESSVLSYEVVRPYPDLEVSAAYDAKLIEEGRFRSGFAPWNDYPEGTSMGTGACCRDRMPDVRATDATRNFTGSWEYIAWLQVNMITSDRPDILATYLTALDRRDLSAIQ